MAKQKKKTKNTKPEDFYKLKPNPYWGFEGLDYMPKQSDLDYALAMRRLDELEKVLEGDEEAEREGVE